MPQSIIYLSDKLNEKIEILSKKLNISKADVIIKILDNYKSKKGGK